MPIRSEAQRRWLHAAESRGDLPKGTAARWEDETADTELPEKVSQEFTQVALKPGTYRFGELQATLTEKDFEEIAANTRAMLAAGLSVPIIYSHHGEIDQPVLGNPDDVRDSAGWLTDVSVDNNGNLVEHMRITDPWVAQSIENGTIKYTSPSLKENYIDGLKRNWGRIVRHVALTNQPRNPDQSQFRPVQEYGLCFSLDDYIETPKEEHASDLSEESIMTDDRFSALVTSLKDAAILPAEFEDGAEDAVAAIVEAITASRVEPEEDRLPDLVAALQAADILPADLAEDMLEVENLVQQIREFTTPEPEAPEQPATVDEPANFSEHPDPKVRELYKAHIASQRAAAEQRLDSKLSKLPAAVKAKLAPSDLSFSDGEPVAQFTLEQVADLIGELFGDLLFSEGPRIEVAPPSSPLTSQQIEAIAKIARGPGFVSND